MSDDAEFNISTKMVRGTSSDDKETIKADVSADSVDELDEKLAQLQERLESWAGEVREIQPDGSDSGRQPADQSTLGAES